jgi:hypothetical protein
MADVRGLSKEELEDARPHSTHPVLEQHPHNRTTLSRAAAISPIQRSLQPESNASLNAGKTSQREDGAAVPASNVSLSTEHSKEAAGRVSMSHSNITEHHKQASSDVHVASTLSSEQAKAQAVLLAEPVARNDTQVRAPSVESKAVGPHQGMLQSLWHRLQQRGLLGVYNQGQAVQPSILMVVMVVTFIAFQIIALAFVAYHAHSSLAMLRGARHENLDMRASRLRELIPGISWNECVPYDSRGPWSSSQQLHGICPKRSGSASVHGDEGVFEKVAASGLSAWFKKQRSQYLKSAGQASSEAPPQSRVVQGRHSAAPPWGSTPPKELSHKLQPPSHKLQLPRPSAATTDSGADDSLKSTMANARRTLDMNRRVNMLQQDLKATTFDAMLDMEYDAMVQWDIESNLSPGLTRRDARSPPIAC